MIRSHLLYPAELRGRSPSGLGMKLCDPPAGRRKRTLGSIQWVQATRRPYLKLSAYDFFCIFRARPSWTVYGIPLRVA